MGKYKKQTEIIYCTYPTNEIANAFQMQIYSYSAQILIYHHVVVFSCFLSGLQLDRRGCFEQLKVG